VQSCEGGSVLGRVSKSVCKGEGEREPLSEIERERVCKSVREEE